MSSLSGHPIQQATCFSNSPAAVGAGLCMPVSVQAFCQTESTQRASLSFCATESEVPQHQQPTCCVLQTAKCKAAAENCIVKGGVMRCGSSVGAAEPWCSGEAKIVVKRDAGLRRSAIYVGHACACLGMMMRAELTCSLEQLQFALSKPLHSSSSGSSWPTRLTEGSLASCASLRVRQGKC